MAKVELKTDSQIKKAIKDTTKTTAYPIVGYTGLELNVRVSTTGKQSADFRHRYTHPITGKRPYMTLGSYPAFSLEQARQAYNDNLALLAMDIDPLEHRENQKQIEINERKNTLQYFIDEWKENQLGKKLAKQTLNNQRKALKPIEATFSQTPITDIKSSDVIRFIKDIQKTHPAKGLHVKTVLKSILQIAKANGIIEYNPASDLQGTIKPYKKAHHSAITTPAEFAKLLNDIDNLADSDLYHKEILQLLALTFCRVGDVCAMKWSDINLFNKQWEFRPQKAGNRDDMTDIVTPLAPQAIAILERMRALTGGREYVFYNGRRKDQKHADPQQIRKVLNSQAMNDGDSYLNVHSPHGFRASAKTMLMERLGYDELLTELQLGHRMMNSYGRAYSRMDMIKQRTEMMTAWANYLDDLKAGKIDNVIYLDKVKEKAINE